MVPAEAVASVMPGIESDSRSRDRGVWYASRVMSTTAPHETDAKVPPVAPEPVLIEERIAGQDRLSPALTAGVLVILLLCIALALVAYQGA